MSDVVDINSRRKNPHNTGPARCVDCSHEFIAVAPVGLYWLECPACHFSRAHFLGVSNIDGAHVFTCNACGCQHFNLIAAKSGDYPAGAFCPGCGQIHEWESFVQATTNG